MTEILAKFPFLKNEYFGNTVEAYLLSLGIFLAAILILFIVRQFVLIKLNKLFEIARIKIDDVILRIFERLLVPILYFGAFYFAIRQLVLSGVIQTLVSALTISVIVIQLTRLVHIVSIKLLNQAWTKHAKIGTQAKVSKPLLVIVHVVVWGVGIVFLLDNLGFNVSAVVAGLGIGGIAVALAAQTILGDLFNYFVIFMDRPFEEGDFIIIGEYMGVIENIGIKTTRIRSLGGEQIVFSNTDLTSSRVRNYKRMQERRVLFKLGVIYQTSKEKMARISEIIREIIQGVEKTRFDRAHFKGFGDFSLDVEIVYYVLSADYNVYMDIQQQINLKIQEVFVREGIEFAYPTQTLFLEKVAAPQPNS